MKKRILQYGLSNNLGGIEVVSINIFKNIDKKGFIFDYIVIGEEIAFEKEIYELGGKVYKITRRRVNPLKHYKEIITFFKKNAKNYDAIHCSYCSLFSILPLILAKIFGVNKIILHAHSSKLYSNKIRLKLAHSINKYFANILATDFVAVTEESAQLIFTKGRIMENRYILLKNPIDLEKFEFSKLKRDRMREYLEVTDCFVLGHVGTFLSVKNHEFIIKVFYELQLLNDKSKLILVGDGNLFSKVVKQAEELGIKEKIIFTGVVKNPYDYLQAMDAFLFPSLYEGLPVTLIEAQANGLRCIVSDVITKKAKITDLVEFVSLRDSAKTWAEIILNDTDRLRSDRVAEVSEEGFSISKITKEYEELYSN